ncbi:MAG: hypothetical protein M0R80_07660 [Proteobacteria bacterium]|jgi:hypothetical protein|nr:hypothetical protein [Pseudomonadota bacterium]
MACVYTHKDFVDALNACWKLLRIKANLQENDNGLHSIELAELMEKHQCLAELEESGEPGYCGIGLGHYGGHAV